MRRRNYSFWPPEGLVLAVQYWAGDEHAAMRLARLVADLETEKRDDVVLALCRAYDTPKSRLAIETLQHCAEKFRVMTVQSDVPGDGHPDGANALWSGTFAQLYGRWRAGRLSANSVFFVESDGAPVRRDWLTMIKREHDANVLAGKRVTGAVTTKTAKHVNGNLVAHLSLWGDHFSLHDTPAGYAWDMFHAAVLMGACAPTQLIKNMYGATDWSPGVLEAARHETAYLANVKDDSVVNWAERELLDEIVPEGPVINIKGARG